MIVHPAKSAERGFDTCNGRREWAKKWQFGMISALKRTICDIFGSGPDANATF
jgi:hypothetical protein